ncbi:mannitol dehydrogenase family protein [Marinomonas ostreistagni]|uniref:Mannitol dehydrogenase family protein n=1 Tax=Marinomonas ostreistagni TaxID=359209 RepID=A0ABS0Z9N3_9GAMM|nr:mannitol dehydrogenase family protein [Marinomonas ostreistagni]MBJ7549696.1 mannitol dehydrogenase family protein [Marinomonas ostreistagni]
MSNTLNATRNADQLLVRNYDRSDIQAGVMHLGVGAFHRAHQAVYFDRLLETPEGKNWGVVGVNLRPHDSKAFERFSEQNGEYVLKTMDPEGNVEYEQIRAIIGQIDGAKTPELVDETMAGENIKLVTSTVTEGGYYLDENRQLMLDHEAIDADIAGGRNTIYAFLYAGLKLRSQTSNAKITLLCCDNLRHNGEVLEAGLMQFLAAKGDTELATWVQANVTFPCSMVDRITPKPSPIHVKDVQEKFGIDDELTVMGEDYLQWVIQDNFAAERPALDLVKAQFVDDVVAYEEAKIRILNAGHTNVVYQAALKGMHFFDEAMRDDELRDYFDDFITEDSIPAIGESIVDLAAYHKIIARRFSNANIGDTVERICTDGYSKFPIFVYPSLAGCYKIGRTPNKTLEGIAAWFVYLQKSRAGTVSVPYHEPNMEALESFTNDAEGIAAFASDSFLWGEIPTEYPSFTEDLTAAIHTMQSRYA